MKNLIQFDSYIVGYKEDLINYLNDEVKRLRKDEEIGNEELQDYLEQTSNTLEDLKKYDDLTLLALGEDWNSDFVIKPATIEFEF